MKSCAVLLVAVGLICLFQPSEAWPLGDDHKLKANILCQAIFDGTGDGNIDAEDKALFLTMPLFQNPEKFYDVWDEAVKAVGKDGKFDIDDGNYLLNKVYNAAGAAELTFEAVFYSRLDADQRGGGLVEPTELATFKTKISTIVLPDGFGGVQSDKSFNFITFSKYVTTDVLENILK